MLGQILLLLGVLVLLWLWMWLLWVVPQLVRLVMKVVSPCGVVC